MELHRYKFAGGIESKPLYRHQAIGVARCYRKGVELGYWALLDDCGLGKTVELIYTALLLKRCNVIDRIIVVTKADLTQQWKEEFAEFAPELIATDLHGRKPDQRRFGIGDVFILNYELFSRQGKGRRICNAYVSGTLPLSADGENMLAYMERYRCALILDEGHKIKNPDSRTTRTLCALGKYAAVRYIATATLEGESPADVWSQMFFLDHGALLGVSYKKHCRRYILYEQTESAQGIIKRPVGFKNLSVLKSKIQTVSIRRLKSECTDLPPKIMSHRYLNATGKQFKLLREIRDSLLNHLSSETDEYISILGGHTNPTVSGGLNDLLVAAATPSAIDPSITDSCKLRMVMDVLDEDLSQLLVWCTHRKVVDATYRFLLSRGVLAAYAYGGNLESVAGFKAGDFRVLVATVDSLKEGQNLQAASHAAYLQYPWSRLTWSQSQDRQHRIGQTLPVVIETPYLTQSLDAYQHQMLLAKESAANYTPDVGSNTVTLRKVDLIDSLKSW